MFSFALLLIMNSVGMLGIPSIYSTKFCQLWYVQMFLKLQSQTKEWTSKSNGKLVLKTSSVHIYKKLQLITPIAVEGVGFKLDRSDCTKFVSLKDQGFVSVACYTCSSPSKQVSMKSTTELTQHTYKAHHPVNHLIPYLSNVLCAMLRNLLTCYALSGGG